MQTITAEAIRTHANIHLAYCGARTYEGVRENIDIHMEDEYNRHYYLLEEGSLRGGEVARFMRMAEGDARPAERMRSLTWLSTRLARHHGAQTVILIDEYDTPINDAHLHGYRSEAMEFYRSWLSDALKGTTSLYFAATRAYCA